MVPSEHWPLGDQAGGSDSRLCGTWKVRAGLPAPLTRMRVVDGVGARARLLETAFSSIPGSRAGAQAPIWQNAQTASKGHCIVTVGSGEK